MPKQAIQNLSPEELARFLEKEFGERVFRARQIQEWIYRKGVRDFNGMTDLPESLRSRLGDIFIIGEPKKIDDRVSADGTRKLLFELRDGERIESALIPAGRRTTLCVSSQAGCRYACVFCASGLKGFRRHLTSAEITGQVLYCRNHYKEDAVTHVVFMGIGEPLDNYDQVLRSVRILNHPAAFHIAARRITISTCGLIPQIDRLAGEGLQVELSISLHGYDEASRRRLMPVSRRYSFDDLVASCRRYARATGRQITFEYILIKDFTCTAGAARALAASLKGMLCKMNLIPYNKVRELEYEPPSRREILSFQDQLARHKIHATLRTPRGQDIGAACGQLRLSRPAAS